MNRVRLLMMDFIFFHHNIHTSFFLFCFFINISSRTCNICTVLNVDKATCLRISSILFDHDNMNFTARICILLNEEDLMILLAVFYVPLYVEWTHRFFRNKEGLALKWSTYNFHSLKLWVQGKGVLS